MDWEELVHGIFIFGTLAALAIGLYFLVTEINGARERVEALCELEPQSTCCQLYMHTGKICYSIRMGG